MNVPPPTADEDENQQGLIGQEAARRQQMMRFGLLIFLLFLILDNRQPPANRVSGGGHSSDNSASGFAEIPLNAAYARKMKAVLSSDRHEVAGQRSMNATGLFRGSWTHVHVQPNSSHSSTGGGTALVQLVSVPVREVSDVSFVYGLLHLYKDVHREAGGAVHVSLEAGFPLQGVLVSSQQKLVLFSTPYKSQRLYVRMGSRSHYNDTVSVGGAPNNDSGQRRSLQEHQAVASSSREDGHGDAGAVEGGLLQLSSGEAFRGAARDLLRWMVDARPPPSDVQEPGFEAGLLKGADAHRQRKLSQQQAATLYAEQQGARDSIAASVLRAFGAESVGPARAREVKLTSATPQGFLSVVLTDQPLQPRPQQTPSNGSASSASGGVFVDSGAGANISTASTPGTERAIEEADFLVSIALGESLLPARFKALQSSGTPPSVVVTLATNRTAGVGGSGSSAGTGAESNLPAAGPAPQKLPSLPAECQYTIQLAPASQSSADPQTATVDPTRVTIPASIQPLEPAGPADGAAQESSGEREQGQVDADPKKQKAERLEPVLRLSGAVSSPNCKKEFTLQASAFNLELDVLRRKVDTYALAATFASLVQVFLVVFQMKQVATQAQVSRISIAAVFAQSLLDANLCMVHLLLCFAFPTLFFGSFIWIAVIKLLLFSVFQMRLIINIYQARYSQELMAEGWQGLRTRLISLHARFYGAVLLILLVSVTFYTRPVVAVLALYSFWVPQILHSAYSGTKHSLHPAYMFGTSLARCFIPLYLLGCPNNFLTLLTIYINPQYLAVLSDAAVASASTGAAGLQGLSLSSAAACWVLVLWQAAQLGMLVLQSSLGPRFFVPKQWLPQRYDYRRSIPQSVRAALSSHGSGSAAPAELSSSREAGGDIAMIGIRSRGTSSSARVNGGGTGGSAGGSSVGSGLQALLFGSGSGVRRSDSDDEEQDLETGSLLGAAARRDRDREEATALSPTRTSAVGGGSGDPSTAAAGNRHEAECVICYNPIRLSTGDYMITPCDHVFHEDCLVRWAGVKLECPVCRAALPAMEEDHQ